MEQCEVRFLDQVHFSHGWRWRRPPTLLFNGMTCLKQLLWTEQPVKASNISSVKTKLIASKCMHALQLCSTQLLYWISKILLKFVNANDRPVGLGVTHKQTIPPMRHDWALKQTINMTDNWQCLNRMFKLSYSNDICGIICKNTWIACKMQRAVNANVNWSNSYNVGTTWLQLTCACQWPKHWPAQIKIHTVCFLKIRQYHTLFNVSFVCLFSDETVCPKSDSK